MDTTLQHIIENGTIPFPLEIVVFGTAVALQFFLIPSLIADARAPPQ